ncbi:MAG TPA: PKD domain-containing protein [Solirubrobacteraceae bacterium]|nr:PKD domain-containing protein [Solirubrobacteraceae bacterium]
MTSTVPAHRPTPRAAVGRRSLRAGLTLATALVALAIGSPSARAEGLVRIVTVGGAGGQTVSLSQLGAPDVPDYTYSTVATPGAGPQSVTVTSGYSLPKLFKDLHIPTTFGSAEILAPQGPPVVLDNLQAVSPYAYHGELPVVWADGAGTHFLVPSTPSGNTNAGETFAGQGGIITIELHRGPPLSIGISGPVKAYVDKPVAFSASVYGGAASLYQWSFGDGSLSSEVAPSHVFTAVGTYDVYLQVTGGADSVGASSVIPVVVGTPPPVPAGAGAGAGGNGTGTGSGSGAGGTGAGTGAGAQSTSTPPHRAQRSAHRRARQAPRPVGPLVSGIAISYIAQPATATGGTSGGAAGAARAAHVRANARGLRYGMWIWFGVLVALFGGGLLELRGSWRVSPPITEAP